jgi:hypothetical protein
MVGAFSQLVTSFEKHYGLSRQDAIQKASEAPAEYGQKALTGPADEVDWLELHHVAQTDPERATARWEEIKRAALDELRTGHRAARAVETLNFGAWPRAQFLALREELGAEWVPRNGIERQLIDTMAHAQAGYLYWLRLLTMRSQLESVNSDRRHREEGRWEAPRQRDAEALEQAAGMVDRFNRLFLRTLRSLCEMRRRGGPVIVQNGGQMNVAQQQVNLSTSPASRAG